MIARIKREWKRDREFHLGRYGTFLHRFTFARFQWTISLCRFEECWSLHFFCLWITLWRNRSDVHPKEMMDSWGFSFHPFGEDWDCLHLNWRNACKIVHMPWDYTHWKTEVMLKDGTFVEWDASGKRTKGFNGYLVGWKNSGPQQPRIWAADGTTKEEVLDKIAKYVPREDYQSVQIVPGFIHLEWPEPENRYREEASYHYRQECGEILFRTATVTADRMYWNWRGVPFRWFRWPRKVRTSIDVKFDGEVGEAGTVGSWKGGCVGCGYDLQPNETPIEALRRMEKERRFR